MKFIFDVICLSRPGKSVNPNFRQYQSYRKNDKFNCCLEIQQKKVCESLYLHPKHFKTTFKSDSYLMSISRRGAVTPSAPAFSSNNLKKK